MKKVYIIAAVIAVLAGALLFVYLGNLEASKEPSIETEAVVTAVRDIPAYTTIDATMLTFTNYPKGAAHPKAARNIADIIGRTTEGAILSGEQILTEKLKSDKSGMSYIVPDGMRAVTIAVNEVTGIAGFIKTADHVDVVCTATTEYSDKYNTSVVIVQNVKVAALDKKVVSATSSDGTVTASTYTYLTLFVTPQQAVEIVHASNTGTLSVTLRNFNDHASAALSPVDNRDFLR